VFNIAEQTKNVSTASLNPCIVVRMKFDNVLLDGSLFIHTIRWPTIIQIADKTFIASMHLIADSDWLILISSLKFETIEKIVKIFFILL
jgi:hypothetical protein